VTNSKSRGERTKGSVFQKNTTRGNWIGKDTTGEGERGSRKQNKREIPRGGTSKGVTAANRRGREYQARGNSAKKKEGIVEKGGKNPGKKTERPIEV